MHADRSDDRLQPLLEEAGRLLGVPCWQPGAAVLGDRAHGWEIVTVEGTALLDLTAGGGTRLLGADEPAVLEALRDAAERALPTGASTPLGIEVAAELRRRLPFAERVALCSSHGEALRLALRLARAATRRERVVRLLPEAPELEGPSIALDPSEALDALGDEVAAVVARPIAADDAGVRVLRAVGERAAAVGAMLVLDESETAFRCAAAGAYEAFGLAPDLVVLGPQIAHGLPFGAVLGRASLLDAAGARFTAPPLALAAAHATLQRLAAAPVHDACGKRGESLRSAFVEACAEQAIHGHALGPPARLRIVFDGQENADADLIMQKFVEEGLEAGLVLGPLLLAPGQLDDGQTRRAAAALRATVARLRTLLIEHNSYLSGGLRWPFEPEPEEIAARGLAIYRFPKRAEVDVSARGSAIEIAFAPGPLGEVTSSGFYAPTFLRGDFTVEVSYRLQRWQPGASSACLALFVQDERSELRFYSQRRSAGTGAHEVLGNFHNRELTTPRPVQHAHGAFRLERQGDRVCAWHRDGDGDWLLLGERAGDPPRDVVLGAKIWSSGEVAGLHAALSDLRVVAHLAPKQPPPMPVRPDPRAT